MKDKEILDFCVRSLNEKDYIHLPEQIFENCDKSQAEKVADEFGANALMRLPEKDIRFFEWLKENDRKIWEDLWGEDEENLYLVGASFMPLFVEGDGRGFPICDLLENDNFYFTIDCMVDEESKVTIETARNRFLAKKPVSCAQLLALEISTAPIDVWRFSYKHDIDLDEAKRAVEILVEDGALVHLKNVEYLSPLVKF